MDDLEKQEQQPPHHAIYLLTLYDPLSYISYALLALRDGLKVQVAPTTIKTPNVDLCRKLG